MQEKHCLPLTLSHNSLCVAVDDDKILLEFFCASFVSRLCFLMIILGLVTIINIVYLCDQRISFSCLVENNQDFGDRCTMCLKCAFCVMCLICPLCLVYEEEI